MRLHAIYSSLTQPTTTLRTTIPSVIVVRFLIFSESVEQ